MISFWKTQNTKQYGDLRTSLAIQTRMSLAKSVWGSIGEHLTPPVPHNLFICHSLNNARFEALIHHIPGKEMQAMVDGRRDRCQPPAPGWSLYEGSDEDDRMSPVDRQASVRGRHDSHTATRRRIHQPPIFGCRHTAIGPDLTGEISAMRSKRKARKRKRLKRWICKAARIAI